MFLQVRVWMYVFAKYIGGLTDDIETVMSYPHVWFVLWLLIMCIPECNYSGLY